jgi:hypothetical protein
MKMTAVMVSMIRMIHMAHMIRMTRMMQGFALKTLIKVGVLMERKLFENFLPTVA